MDTKMRSCSSLSVALLLFFLLSSLNIQQCVATDIISSGESLSGNQTIVSKESNFELGFFTPRNSRNYYVGIWYKRIPVQTVIWVANRATPITNTSSAEFKISEDGKLVLLNSSKILVWSTNSTPSTSDSTVAVLLDTGNLVIRNGSNTTIWESFGHPTDTLMPEGWIGVNKITGEFQSATSWESPENPAPGPFTLSLGPDRSKQFVLLWNDSEIYWSSGLWNGRYFPALPATTENTPFNLTFIDNEQRMYGMYTIFSSSFITHTVIGSSGLLTQRYWLDSTQEWQSISSQPLPQCDVYSLCGAFGICDQKSSDNICSCSTGFEPASMKEWELNVWSSGCVRKTSLRCSNKSSAGGEGDRFLEMTNMRLPPNPQNLTVGSAKYCEQACLNNCSCNAYAYGSVCSIWTGDLRNLVQLYDGDSGAGTLYLRLAASDFPGSRSSHKLVIGLTLSVIGGILGILCVLVGLFWAFQRRKRIRIAKQVEGSLILFTYGDLQHATKNFSEKLGSGGFGSVFKGTLADSTNVAVKKLEGLRQGDKQFRNEVSTLAAVQHVNVVRLRGFCSEGSKRLLVYEYMSGGSLDSHLFQNNSAALDWRMRYQTILGIARGLAYLHEKCRERIIHCDLKPDNILLDGDFCAKVADFGMAKLIGRDFSRVLTTLRGTVGYLAPEWISGLPITSKVDVYSFGMMLFELISGKRNTMHSVDGSKIFYPSWAATKIIEGDIFSLLDDRLNGAADVEELTRVCRVACWCIQDSEGHRPTMGQVVQILEGVLEVSMPPLPRALQLLMEDQSQIRDHLSSTEYEYALDQSLDLHHISLGQSVSGNRTIVSKGGNFELGFFTPGNSRNYYIGIWYKTIPGQTVFWVANRATPISNTSSAVFKISEDGKLVLLNGSKIPVWSSNSTPSTSESTVAVLLDTGNLVIRNGSNTTIWQSFDHPTDTWMPGGWLGVNKITGEYQSITSWENPDNPAPGLFAESMDPDGSNQFVLLWNGSEVYWSSGPWNGQYFSEVPTTAESTPFNFTFNDNNQRKYAMYTILDSSFITRCVIDSSGLLKQWYWLNSSQEWQTVFTQPVAQCDVYSLCGAFGICDQKSSNICRCSYGFEPASMKEWEFNVWNSGCVRKTSLRCSNKSSAGGEGDRFLEMTNMRLPASPQNLTVGSAEDCEQACLNNCSCNAYAYVSGCSIWTGDLRNLQQLYDGDRGVGTLHLRLAASDFPASSSSNKLVKDLTPSVIGGILVILCVLFGLIWVSRRRKRARMAKQVEGSLIHFSYSDLQHVTKNFSEKLGGGGFGSVFKGTLIDSSEVAVKKLEGLRQGEKQFRTEVSTLAAIQHVNLVRLRGFCSKGSERLLVYEYMSGGSLDSHLFQNNSTVLDWKMRYQIILGIARGLAYLHEKCRECIIHCDIKPDNILLDKDFCAKVADFGMAKLIGRDFSRVLTTMRGTIGYLAPEWISGLPITSKVDAYSFGMMLFELISGNRNTMHPEDGNKIFYPSWAAKRITEGDIFSLLDRRLNGAADIEELTRVCRVACWCIQDSEGHRPTMGQVVQILEGVLEVSMPPLPRALQLLMEDQNQIRCHLSSTEYKDALDQSLDFN
ncbi:putative G-type lectin S-receptor-like serine/threonine-protein kinase [Cocos nucifera]|uniref:non-specific serine/threonine protein kinase n=1 Tax=Cocos nucifera TaxID=13894 RepID=A0A8K0IBE1_COCNU|nr:putative G-type lectin S-receptor-like serine/threonine-protein kinase [Cocos nucifera]